MQSQPVSRDRRRRSIAALLSATASFACSLALLGAPAGAAEPELSNVISYPNFSSTAGLQLNGQTAPVNEALRLTPAEAKKSGTVFSRTEIQPSGSFLAEFTLRIHESNTTGPETLGPADGIAFVLQPQSASAVGTVGGALGYGGMTPSAEVQFDVFRDEFYKPPDPEVPYVSFMEDGNAEAHLPGAISETPLPPSLPLYGETPVEAWVAYNAPREELAVYAALAPGAKPEQPLFTYNVNLAALLGSEFTYAGFTASTGTGDAVQEILSWELSSEQPTRYVPPPPAPVGPTPTPTPAPAPSTPDPTVTTVSCVQVAATASDACSAAVRDSAAAASRPSGTVSFTSTANGALSAGAGCALGADPAIAGVSDCSVVFLAPGSASAEPSITAAYPGDADHAASSARGTFPTASALGADLTLAGHAILAKGGAAVELPVLCRFACKIAASLSSGSNFAAETAAVKRVPLGSGSLTLKRPGKGSLLIALGRSARRALQKAGKRPVKGIVKLNVRTAAGTVVSSEKKTVTIRRRQAKT